MSWIESVLKHTEREVALLGFDKNDLGQIILGTIEKLHHTLGNHPAVMKSVLKMMIDLVDKKPISVITENDFEGDRCTRYEYIYKAPDGKYYNDRAVVFKKSWDDPSEHYVYQGTTRSKREITLPYVLRPDIQLLP